ncbi:response regulator [Hylemonella gracilis]|uniref:Response regulator n=1 Tax=Hylemonella gracilis TaxID=80880 RepID=A0A4P6URP3_9BURK|nr:response regulator transcription factor [Hylemonella gracilis]QBK06441.1 response regulator [Hylemonella gracilis]
MKILVVEHSELIRIRLARQIGTILGVNQVIAALDRVQAQRLFTEMQPALIVLDLHLPDGDSVPLIPQFKSKNKDLKIAVLTNDATDYNRQRCLRAGAGWFFDKSTEFEQLLEQLRRLSDPTTTRRAP